MSERIAGIDIPGSRLAREATELVRDAASPLLFHHSRRVFLFGSLQGKRLGLTADPPQHQPALRDRRRGRGAPIPHRARPAPGAHSPCLAGHRTAHDPGNPLPPGARSRSDHRWRGNRRARHRLPGAATDHQDSVRPTTADTGPTAGTPAPTTASCSARPTTATCTAPAGRSSSAPATSSSSPQQSSTPPAHHSTTHSAAKRSSLSVRWGGSRAPPR
jgi:hypothetical protein